MRRARSGGFTLVELMITTLLMMVIMTGVMAALIANQQQYHLHAQTSALQSNLRIASTQLEQAIARAGYGIDPGFAVEAIARDPATGAELANGLRDGSGPNGSDELVIHSRDPLFRRQVTSGGTASLTLDAALEADDIAAGDRLLVVCTDGSDFAYVTASGGIGTTVSLGAGEFPFNQTGRLTSNSCLTAGSAVLTKVVRRHFFLAEMADPIGGGTRPMLLVLDGRDLDGDGTPGERPTGWPAVVTDLGDAELLALDVEQFQVAYVLNRPIACPAGPGNCTPDLATDIPTGPDSDGDFVMGDDPAGVMEGPSASAPLYSGAGAPTPLQAPRLNVLGIRADPTCTPGDKNPDTTCSYGGRRRYTSHPANVRAVRFSLSARFGLVDPTLPLTSALMPDNAPTVDPMENLVAAQPMTRHRRQRLEGSVVLRNMFQLKHFAPPSAAGG